MILLLIFTLVFLVISLNLLRKGTKLHSLDKTETTCMKGILAILVVVHHTSYYSHSCFFSEFNYWGNVVCGCFFFLSGFGLMCSFGKKGFSYFDSFLSKHLQKLFVTLLLAYILFVVTLKVTNLEEIPSLSELLKSGNTLLPNVWFVYALALLYVFYYICFGVFKKNMYISFSLLLILVLSYVLVFKRLGYGSYWYSSVFAFWVGTFVPIWESSHTHGIKFNVYKFYLLISIITIVFILIALYSLNVQTIQYAPFLCAFFPLFLYYTLRIIGVRMISFFSVVGNISYELYVIHGIFIYYFHSFIDGLPLLLMTLFCSLIVSSLFKVLSIKLNQLL